MGYVVLSICFVVFGTIVGVHGGPWWPLWLGLIALPVFSWEVWDSARERRRKAEREEALRSVGFDQIDQMSGIEFEKYVASVLKGRGYSVNFTKATGDFGVDLIAAKDGILTAIQCKRKGSPVGGSAVQQVVAGAIMHHCTQTMVVSNTTFTRGATQLANMHRCQLIDRHKLERLALTNPGKPGIQGL